MRSSPTLFGTLFANYAIRSLSSSSTRSSCSTELQQTMCRSRSSKMTDLIKEQRRLSLRSCMTSSPKPSFTACISRIRRVERRWTRRLCDCSQTRSVSCSPERKFTRPHWPTGSRHFVRATRKDVALPQPRMHR